MTAGGKERAQFMVPLDMCSPVGHAGSGFPTGEGYVRLLHVEEGEASTAGRSAIDGDKVMGAEKGGARNAWALT